MFCRLHEVECVFGSDFVKVVLGVVVESYQHAIIFAHYCNESVAFIRDISVSVVLDYAHCYQVVAIGRRIYDGSAVRMIPYLVELYVGVAYPIHSEL